MKRICVECGTWYYPRSGQRRRCDGCRRKICPVCRSEFTPESGSEFACCSRSCLQSRTTVRGFRRMGYAKLCAQLLERMTGERCGIEYRDQRWVKLVRFSGERKMYV